MRTTIGLSIGAVLVTLTAWPASAQRMQTDVGASGRVGAAGTSVRADTRANVRTGQATRSQHGANRSGFCPPGQKKKPGKGSAFQC
jgi:hypothetical protein